MPKLTMAAPTSAAIPTARCQRPALPNVNSATRRPAIANQMLGGSPARDTPANSAIPAIEPEMSNAYARSGGIVRKRGPNGIARKAIAIVVRMSRLGRTMKLMSSRRPSPVANQTSPGSFRMLTWASDTKTTIANAHGANQGAARASTRRPRRMPIPIPRKLERRRKLLKKPT